jgi:hypothetical protein
VSNVKAAVEKSRGVLGGQDCGATSKLSEVTLPDQVANLCCATLFEMPRTVGGQERRIPAWEPAVSRLWFPPIPHKSFGMCVAGTTGLEPATSAVTVLPFQVFQRHTNPWGTPKTTKVV